MAESVVYHMACTYPHSYIPSTPLHSTPHLTLTHPHPHPHPHTHTHTHTHSITHTRPNHRPANCTAGPTGCVHCPATSDSPEKPPSAPPGPPLAPEGRSRKRKVGIMLILIHITHHTENSKKHNCIDVDPTLSECSQPGLEGY